MVGSREYYYRYTLGVVVIIPTPHLSVEAVAMLEMVHEFLMR